MTPDDLKKRIENHPCYSTEAHKKYARIHLPVAPKCNIQCNYCNRRYDCSNESRPGVTSSVIMPEEALHKVISASHAFENLSVVGIAGPGDALANPEATFETFSLVRDYNPELKLCLSTNGLALPQHVDDIVRAGVGHVTVTLNTVDAEIGLKIYDSIGGKKGLGAVQRLIGNQLLGIRMLAAENVIVKINSVLIPGVNDDHIKEVAAKAKELGAYIHNIIPLMSKKEYGTKFASLGISEPDCAMIEKVQRGSLEVMGDSDRVMKHCKRCRADAVGQLGGTVKVADLGLVKA